MTLLKTTFDLEEMVADLSARELSDLESVVIRRLGVMGVPHDCDDCSHLTELEEALDAVEHEQLAADRLRTEASGISGELKGLVKRLGGDHQEAAGISYLIRRLERLAL